MGHGYGLPHSDNADGDDDTYDNPWDVMIDACSNAMYNVNFGALPNHINMAQRDRLGWVDAARQLVIPAGELARTPVQLDIAHRAGAAKQPLPVFAMQPHREPDTLLLSPTHDDWTLTP